MRGNLQQRIDRDLRSAIDKTRAQLEGLEASYRAFRRSCVAGGPGGTGGGLRAAQEAQKAYAQSETSLELLAAAVMADGATWSVADVCAALVRQGVKTSRPSVNSILWRGSRRADGKFALVSRGHYRLKTSLGKDGVGSKEGPLSSRSC